MGKRKEDCWAIDIWSLLRDYSSNVEVGDVKFKLEPQGSKIVGHEHMMPVFSPKALKDIGGEVNGKLYGQVQPPVFELDKKFRDYLRFEWERALSIPSNAVRSVFSPQSIYRVIETGNRVTKKKRYKNNYLSRRHVNNWKLAYSVFGFCFDNMKLHP
ncbi:hypothetical protein PPL_02757 [Heterostelium album PN500]|uniref:Uncharacterized protein n=1 Tax=Heterostelium pallidum (strain ATCC 26659 / Pp 5 / PN500) TaxID=670386 RepID=D3B2Z2_HETP5|nr:hypothetical protein PPL_02757 [Heterostelium album PN500]EFA83690.1 hypothetical protein PPL_02757 [Heterostelium album PN500]|eukprot:XP_020435807.1 hypothetical protein PPL_02757 [Heterostelium album PN500]